MRIQPTFGTRFQFSGNCEKAVAAAKLRQALMQNGIQTEIAVDTTGVSVLTHTLPGDELNAYHETNAVRALQNQGISVQNFETLKTCLDNYSERIKRNNTFTIHSA